MDSLPKQFQSFEPPTELAQLAAEDPVLAETISRYSIWAAVDWYGQGYGGILMPHDFDKARDWVQRDQKELARSVLNASTPEQRSDAIQHICWLATEHTNRPLTQAIDTIAAAVKHIKEESSRPRRQTRRLGQLQEILSERTAAFITEAFPDVEPNNSVQLRRVLAEATVRDPSYAQTLLEEARTITEQPERSWVAQHFSGRNSSPHNR